MANSDLETVVNLDLSVPPVFLSCGRFVGDEGWTHRSRVIDSWELIYGLDGPVFLQEETRRYELMADDVLVFSPGLRHGGWRPSKAGASFLWMHFRPALGPETVRLARYTRGARSHRLRVALQQLLDLANGGRSNPLLCQYLCGIVLLEYGLETEAPSVGRGPGDDETRAWFEGLLAWARMQVDRPLTVHGLARQAGKNPDYLNRVFRARLGCTALAYLHRLKMDRARELLMTTDQPVKQIAYHLGFSDPGAFLRVFRKTTLMTPSQYRHTWTHTRLNSE